MIRSGVTLSWPRKRLNRTSRARSPLESRRRQTSLPATMRSTSAAPLYRDDDPRIGPTSDLSATTSVTPPQRSAEIEITRTADSGIPAITTESIRRTRYVHALVRSQGRRPLLPAAVDLLAHQRDRLLIDTRGVPALDRREVRLALLI